MELPKTASGWGRPARLRASALPSSVGASTKVTLARWHLLEPEDVVECVALLAGVGGGGSGASSEGAGPLCEMNLAAISAVEGRIPAGTE